MYCRFIVIGLFFLFTNRLLADDFQLQSGDLLFQVKTSSFSDAIADVSTGKDSIHYTHVGIVSIENDSVFVIEAIPPVVCRRTFEKFLNESKCISDSPIVAVGRLKSKYHNIIPIAITNAYHYLNKPYDYIFYPNNDAYYCSELVSISFLNELGKPIFPAQSMTFRTPQGDIPPFWIEHFKKYGVEIPEGLDGTNPSDMSASDAIDIIYRYF